MTGSIHRITAIIRTDLRIRFRRMGSIVTLLIIAAAVYLIVPSMNGGYTLMSIGNQRVIYNSAAVSLATAMLCSILLIMVGYYLVSNSVRRDFLSRTGSLIASSPVTNMEYILGKFTGNVVHLSLVTLACMGSSMVMFLLRGERALEPLVFISTYGWMVSPAILFCSATAIAFEALPVLSGRFGDVVYFFLWGTILAIPALFIEQKQFPWWLSSLDFLGLLTVVRGLQSQYHTNSISIGISAFKASEQPILFTGFSQNGAGIAERFLTLWYPAILLVGARFWFHRFNPVRVRHSRQHGEKKLFERINKVLRPVTGLVHTIVLPRSGSFSFAASVRADFVCSLLLSPVTTLAIVVCGILALALKTDDIQHGLLPVIIGVVIVATANITSRDRSSRTAGFLCTAPGIRERYVIWKLFSCAVLTFSFTIIPFFRLLASEPPAAVSLFIGSLFLASCCVGMGILSGGPKLFIATFLMLLYIALNARTDAGFDFAGFNGAATSFVRFLYALTSMAIILIAQMRYLAGLRTQ